MTREPMVGVVAALAAAISLLENGGKAAKKAAPSDKMFDMMLRDYKKALASGRAALTAPAPAPDDEALITSLEMESAAVSECFQNGSQDEIHEAIDDLKKAREALRRRIAELRLSIQCISEDHDAAAKRTDKAEASLAACRDKVIDECARVADKYIVEGLETVNSVKREIACEIRALKGK